MANILAVAQEVDQLSHRMSAMGFQLEARTHGPIEKCLDRVSYVVSKDDIIVLHTTDRHFVNAYITLLELVTECNKLS